MMKEMMKETATKMDKLLRAGDIAEFNNVVDKHDHLATGFAPKCFGVQSELKVLGWQFIAGRLATDGGYYPALRNSKGELVGGYSTYKINVDGRMAYQWQNGCPGSHAVIIIQP